MTRVYRERLPPGGAVLDLMSSWVIHLPYDVAYASVVGHGMNEEQLAANPRLSRWFVQDLNIEPGLPLGNDVFDGACLCVSVQYLQRPADVFRQVGRALRPGAVCGVVLQPVPSDQGGRNLAIDVGTGPAASGGSIYAGRWVHQGRRPDLDAAARRSAVDCDRHHLTHSTVLLWHLVVSLAALA